MQKPICKQTCNDILSMPSKVKFLSEAPIFASTNPQYDDGLFIDLQVQYMKTPSSEHVENMLCTEIVFDIQNIFLTTCFPHVLQKEQFLTKIYLYLEYAILENWRFQYFLISSHLYLKALEMKKTTILTLKRVFEIFLEEVGPWLPLGASRNGKGIIPRLQLLVFLFYVTSGIPFRHLAVASGKFIIYKSYRELLFFKIFLTQADCCCSKLGQHREHLHCAAKLAVS